MLKDRPAQSMQRQLKGFIKDELFGRGIMPEKVQNRLEAQSSSKAGNDDREFKRNDDGEFDPKVEDDAILHHFEAGDRPFYSSQDVADRFGLDRSTAHRRLETLYEKDELKKIRVGKNSVIWWRQRDTIILSENDTGGYTAIDTASGIASEGDTRPDALRMVAEAVELADESEEEVPTDLESSTAPWFDDE